MLTPKRWSGLPTGTKFDSLMSRFKDLEKAPTSISKDDLATLELNDEKQIEKTVKNMHRNAEDVVKDMMKVISTYASEDIPPLGSYIAVILDPKDAQDLASSVSIPPKWHKHAHHVTLVHSHDFTKRINLWKEAISLLSDPVQIHVSSVVLDSQKLIAAKVTISPAKESSSSSNVECLDHLVSSGVPHITIAVAPGIEPFESVAVLSGKNPALKTSSYNKTISGTIQLVTYSKPPPSPSKSDQKSEDE